VEVQVEVAGADVSIIKGSLTLHNEIGQRISTAEFIVAGEEAWPFAHPGFPYTFPFIFSPRGSLANSGQVVAIGGFTRPYCMDDVQVNRKPVDMINCGVAPGVVGMGGNSSYIDHFFGGYIVEVEKMKKGMVETGAKALYRCKAKDYNMLPEKILVTKAYVAQTEQQIIDDLFSSYLPEINTTTYVESGGGTFTLDWTRRTLLECLEELATIYVKEWYIDYDKNLHYFTPVTTAAPFVLSDIPALSQYQGYHKIRHIEDILEIANRVTVVGDTGGPVVVTRTEAGSYAEYGYYFDDKIVDPNIDTATWANAVGDAALIERAYEKVTGSLICWHEGLVKGQMVRIINAFRGIDAYYLVQAVTLKMLSRNQEKITIRYGDHKPRLIDVIKKINKEERKE